MKTTRGKRLREVSLRRNDGFKAFLCIDGWNQLARFHSSTNAAITGPLSENSSWSGCDFFHAALAALRVSGNLWMQLTNDQHIRLQVLTWATHVLPSENPNIFFRRLLPKQFLCGHFDHQRGCIRSVILLPQQNPQLTPDILSLHGEAYLGRLFDFCPWGLWFCSQSMLR